MDTLFVFTRKDDLIYLLLYVDDIILTRNNPALINGFISQLHSEFAVNDLGPQNYFLRLEVSYIPDGFFHSQVKYAIDILARAQLLDKNQLLLPGLSLNDSPLKVLHLRIRPSIAP